MPNPSEMCRLEEESEDLKTRLNLLHRQLDGAMYRDKATKENILREIRKVERELGVESRPYNSNSF